MKISIIIIVTILLIAPSVSIWACGDPSCIGATTSCVESYCKCNSNRIFNCTALIVATTLSQGTYSFLATQNQPLYFILDVPVDQQLTYYVKLTDSAYSDFLSAYNLGFYIDQGTGQSKGYPSGYYSLSDNAIELQLSFELSYLVGTSISQRLIVNTTFIGSGSSTFSIQFSQQSFRCTSLMMILAYIAGGILLIATIVMLIIMCKRNREQTRNRRERQIVQSRKTNDISHFNALMPIGTVGIKQISEGATCSVCLGQFNTKDLVRTTVCGHIFHSTCIDQWCAKNISCPVCRTELTQQNVIQMRNNTDPSNDNSSWVVNTIDYSDDDQPESRRGKRVERVLDGGQSSRRQMQRPLTRDIGNDQL